MKTVPRVIGAINQHCLDIVADLYETLLNIRVYKVSDPKTANAVKLTENLFRDVNIALANEFALVFERLGIDALEVIKACGTKYNFMPHYPELVSEGRVFHQTRTTLFLRASKPDTFHHLSEWQGRSTIGCLTMLSRLCLKR